jgi:hypothetical protein
VIPAVIVKNSTTQRNFLIDDDNPVMILTPILLLPNMPDD